MKIQTMWTKVIVLGLLLCGASVSNASALVITGGDGNPAITRFKEFSTNLTATVTDPPKDTAEATISGPIYKWSGGGSGLSLPSPTPNTATVTISSGSQPNYDGGGQKTVPFNCVAVYTSTDKKTNVQTPISISGPAKNVLLFIRVPKSIRCVDPDPRYGRIVTVLSGPNSYGHEVVYTLEIDDNQDNPQMYADGGVTEKFSSYTANPNYAVDLGRQGAPGPEITANSTTGGQFGDSNTWTTYTSKIPGVTSVYWPDNKVDQTGYAGPNDLWYDFDQTAHSLEAPPWDPSAVEDIPLNPTFVISHHRDYVTRD